MRRDLISAKLNWIMKINKKRINDDNGDKKIRIKNINMPQLNMRQFKKMWIAVQYLRWKSS